jgi:hypothetical protein
MSSILLPLAPVRNVIRQSLREIHQYHVPFEILNTQTDLLLMALLDQWFCDPEGAKLAEFIRNFDDNPFETREMVLELQETFWRLIRDTVGTLVPSLRYRFAIEEDGDTLRITPTLPTLDDYAERLAELANPDTGWVPPRYR